VIAVDGVLVATLAPRAATLHAAAEEVGLPLDAPRDARWYAGRDWSEMARSLAGPAPDETLVDLAALVAERRWAATLGSALPLVDEAAVAHSRHAVLEGWRVILRADTTRRAGAMLLDALATASTCSRVVAGDDVPVGGSAGEFGLARRQYGAMGWRPEWEVREAGRWEQQWFGGG
jgi:phosphoglycolate phosphatase-like HAD superfamily hydrolase